MNSCKVLVVNRCYCSNLGDQAINFAMVDFIKRSFQSVEVMSTDLTSKRSTILRIGQPSNNYLLKGFKSLIKCILPVKFIWLMYNFSRIRSQLIEGPDIVIIGGGQLILSNSTFGIACAFWVFISKHYKKKIIFSNVGSGTDFTFLDRFLYKYALNNADGVCVRDLKSKTTIEKLFGVKAYYSGDIVFTENSNETEQPTDKVLLSIPELSVYNTYNPKISKEAYFNNWYDFIISKGIDLDKCVLCFTTQEDFETAYQFKSFVMFNYQIELPVSEMSYSLQELKDLMLISKTVVSGRMHALILGLNAGCDIHVFDISAKLRSFSDEVESSAFNLEDYRDFVKLQTLSFISKFIK